MTQPAPKTKTITLSEPIEHEGGVISEIVIKKPKVRDLNRLEEALKGVTGQMAQGIVTLAVMSGLPTDAIDEMDADDFEAAQKAVADFFPEASQPETGEG